MGWTIVIPARTSEGVIGKNIAQVGNQPLICHAIEAARRTGAKVVVATNDPDIRAVARIAGVEVWARSFDGPTDTIDQFAWSLQEVEPDLFPYMVLQPTTYGYDSDDLAWMMDRADHSGMDRADHSGIYTALTVVQPTTGLYWRWPEDTSPSPVNSRQNRQEQRDLFKEVGIRLHRGYLDTPGYQPMIFRPLSHGSIAPLLDIDTAEDLQAARGRDRRLSIEFNVTVSKERGTGHIRRALTLASHLQHHSVKIVLDAHSDEGLVEVPNRWKARAGYVDVIVRDCLYTSRDWASHMASRSGLVLLEDSGDGVEVADAAISDMYPFDHPTLHGYVGPQYAVLRPEFLSQGLWKEGEGVLATFGGTDPLGLSEKLGRAWAGWGLGTPLTILVPPGREWAEYPEGWPKDTSYVSWRGKANVAEEMAKAMIVITGGGRSVYESMMLGKPTVVVASNNREATHTHLNRGNVYAGNAMTMGPRLALVRYAVKNLLTHPRLRDELVGEAMALVDGRGTERVARIIEQVGWERRK